MFTVRNPKDNVLVRLRSDLCQVKECNVPVSKVLALSSGVNPGSGASKGSIPLAVLLDKILI